MGMYPVWIATGEADIAKAGVAALEICEPYDETENDTPGQWPGVSFDYHSVAASMSVAEAVAALIGGGAPEALITKDGAQVRIAPPDWCDQDDDETASIEATRLYAAPLSFGIENMIRAMLKDPGQTIIAMEWHW